MEVKQVEVMGWGKNNSFEESIKLSETIKKLLMKKDQIEEQEFIIQSARAKLFTRKE